VTRALVVIGSAKGSPGATTLALGLAACWPTSERRPRPLVVEADPSGGDVAARFELSDSPGLMELAAAARRAVSARVLGECVQMLPGGVHVVVGPTGAQQATAAVKLFAGNGMGLLRAGMGSDGSVLVDVGRLQAETSGLVAGADRLLLVTRGEVDALAHTAAQLVQLSLPEGSVELVLVGPSPYPVLQIRKTLGVQRVHQVPWDPRTAHCLASRVAPSPRRWRNASLVRTLTDLAWHLEALVAQEDNAAGRDVASYTVEGAVPGQAAGGVLQGGEVR
jgi:MinD-like ATPase involved in chromosome partitioning or flagellar assembly